MPDLVIKPTAGAGNKLILQDQGGGALLTSATSGATLADGITLADMSNFTFPAGHVIGSNRGIYTFTGDLSVSTTSEAWGPVVPLTLKKANANIYAFFGVDEYYNSGSWSAVFNVVYKSSSFTAAQGNTSHGGALLNQVTNGSGSSAKNNRLRSWAGDRGSFFVQVFNQHSLGNSAGDTYYFAPETIATTTFYTNFHGGQGSVTLNVMEIA